MVGIDLEIYRHRFQSIAEEMGVTLCRSAYSSNIKERRDFSCALFDAQGQAIAQAAHLPVHLGSMPTAVKAALDSVDFAPGDSVIVNDPFAGGTHLPDITMIDPVFIDQQLVFLVANRAHHADIGGMSAGSMPLSTDIFQEGLRIPPVKWQCQGHIQHDLLSLILANVRTPAERRGDLLAQWAANQTGCQRLQSLCQSTSLTDVLTYAAGLQDYAATRMRLLIARIPDGTYTFQDYLEDDGQGQRDLLIQVRIEICDQQAIVDFTGSAAQSTGCLNTIEAVTLSAVLYVFRCLLPENIPTNSGLLRPIQVIAPVGSIVNAGFPSAVVGGNVETSQRIVDVLLGALAQALPDQITAASGGSMNNLLLGGIHQGKPFSYYETLGSGMGAGPQLDGLSGVQTHMTNTLNTPIEALELSFPFRVHQYCLRRETAGTGLQKGGQGLVREIEVLCPTQLTLLTERRVRSPYGLQGGAPGSPGSNEYVVNDQVFALPAKHQQRLLAGERVRVQTPGGGGWGRPKKLL